MLLTLLFTQAVLSEIPIVRVLFIGNSYTYYNNLPELVQRISEVTPGTQVRAESVTFGGWSLQKHWLEGPARARIQEKRWDYVVLQEQSLRPLDNKSQMHRFCRLFVHQVRQAKAKPAFFMTWARQFAPERQPALTTAYREIASETGSTLFPAGEAWAAYLSNGGERLHVSDNSHPNPRGSYLSALTILGVLRGRPVVDPPLTLTGIPEIDPPGSKRTYDLQIKPAELPALLKAAAGVVLEQLDADRRAKSAPGTG